jgi:hypothetical protein
MVDGETQSAGEALWSLRHNCVFSKKSTTIQRLDIHNNKNRKTTVHWNEADSKPKGEIK